MNQLVQWWQSLSLRERQLVNVAGALISVAILYWGIWTPVSNARQAAEDKLQQQLQTLDWVQLQGEFILSHGNKVSRQNVKINQAVSSSARQQRITLSRIQPRGEEVEVWVDQVPFNQLMRWVNLLKERYQIQVDMIDLEATDPEGTVKVRRLKLSKAA